MNDVTVAVDPSDYDAVLQHCAPDADAAAALAFRRMLSWKAFQVRGCGCGGEGVGVV